MIWLFADKNKVKEELENMKEKLLKNAKYDIYELLIPKDFVKYSLILKEREFSFLEELKEDFMNTIQIYLTKWAKFLLNRWIMEQHSPTKSKSKLDDEEGAEETDELVPDTQERVERLFENLFGFLEEKGKRTHGLLKKKFKELINSFNKGLKLDEDFLDIDTIYREIIEKLEKEQISRYNSTTDRSFLMTENSFSVKEAINLCTPIITSRVKNS